MREQLLFLEKSLFQFKYISNKEWLNNIIHDDFKECSKSGLIFDKKDTVEALLSFKTDRNIDIYNFECEPLTPSCRLVHYVTIHDQQAVYRTSIWVGEKQLKLLFHQASLLNQKMDYIKC